MEIKNIIWFGIIAVVLILVISIGIYIISGGLSSETDNLSPIYLNLTNNTDLSGVNNTARPLTPLAINSTTYVVNNTTVVSPFINKTKINFSTSANSTSYPVVAPETIGTKKTWCNYGETWTNSKVPGKTLLKNSFASVNNEILCLVFSEDKSEEYAFTEGEVKVYKVMNPGAKAAPILELIP